MPKCRLMLLVRERPLLPDHISGTRALIARKASIQTSREARSLRLTMPSASSRSVRLVSNPRSPPGAGGQQVTRS